MFDLYKLAIETDRFEIEVGWKLVQFFVLINSGLLTIGFTLIGSDQIPPENKWVVSFIFIIGIVVAKISIKSRKNYHERSLVASCKKTLIEEILKLYEPISVRGNKNKKNNLAISTSPNFELKEEMIIDPVNYVKKNTLKKGSVPYHHMLIFRGFIIVNAIGIFIAVYDKLFLLAHLVFQMVAVG